MDEVLFVRPSAPGLVVLTPERPHTPLPIEGQEVVRNSYWLRAIARGDVLVGRADPATTPNGK